ncbi:MAG: hypothetical protein K2N54_08200 [Helicobacter sp.]|nr:hypothetical protein [Helicobacter sp.]
MRIANALRLLCFCCVIASVSEAINRVGYPALLIATLVTLARNDNGIFCDSVYFFGGAISIAHIK